MSIYSLYEDTYKRLDNKITLSNFLSNNEIKKLNSIFDVCKSIDKNIVLLSLAKSNIDDMDKLRFEAYEQLRSYINCIFDSTEFRTELNDQLANYNINDSLYIYMYQRSIKPFTLKSAHAVIA